MGHNKKCEETIRDITRNLWDTTRNAKRHKGRDKGRMGHNKKCEETEIMAKGHRWDIYFSKYVL